MNSFTQARRNPFVHSMWHRRARRTDMLPLSSGLYRWFRDCTEISSRMPHGVREVADSRSAVSDIANRITASEEFHLALKQNPWVRIVAFSMPYDNPYRAFLLSIPSTVGGVDLWMSDVVLLGVGVFDLQ